MQVLSWLFALLVFGIVACSAAPQATDNGNPGTFYVGGYPGQDASDSSTNAGGGKGGAGGSSKGGRGGASSGGKGGGGQHSVDSCSDAAKLVYVVDADGRFSSFNPKTTPATFVDITKMLNCPAEVDIFGIKATPYSMSVDRNAVAWVLYSSGELFRVDTADGSCKATSFQRNQFGFQLMGMGFVADTQGSTVDTLYVAGGAGPDTGTVARLGTVNMTTLSIAPRQELTGWPELTGTGLAELWGFFPDTTPPKVVKLNKTTGAEDVVYPLATLQGEPAAWAFAFWGGDFWVFLMRVTDADTTVYRIKGIDGAMSKAVSNTSRKIVGAGVSTCAPVVLE